MRGDVGVTEATGCQPFFHIADDSWTRSTVTMRRLPLIQVRRIPARWTGTYPGQVKQTAVNSKHRRRPIMGRNVAPGYGVGSKPEQEHNMKRGEVYQTGPVLPGVGWEGQPPLVYITSPTTAVDDLGHPVDMTDTSKWEYRGSLLERDLRLKERTMMTAQRKLRSWKVRRVEVRNVRIADGVLQPQTIFHPLGTVEAVSREEAKRLAAEQFHGVRELNISRNDPR